MPSLELQARLGALFAARPKTEEAALHSAEFRELVATSLKLFEASAGPLNKPGSHGEALRNFFRDCGAPWNAELIPDVGEVAGQLERAYEQSEFEITHFHVLDFAPTLPDVQFGPCAIRRFKETELSSALKVYRYERFKMTSPNTEELCQFNWLLITEIAKKSFKDRVSAGFLFREFDLPSVGRVFPHGGKKSEYDLLLEQCTFVLALYPWEEITWGGADDIHWQPFDVVIPMSVDNDPFSSPRGFVKSSVLAWEPRSAGDDDYYEVPSEVELPDGSLDDLEARLRDLWNLVEFVCPIGQEGGARGFNKLVKHFLIRGFEENSDFEEFLWDSITIEAALGRSVERKDGKLKNENGHTEKLKARIQKLLGDQRAGESFENFYDLRSAYVHGRDLGDKEIRLGDLRAMRSLARRVVSALLDIIRENPQWSRNDLLKCLDDPD